MKAFRIPAVRLLWSGQALSAIGDEVYSVAMVWFATGLIGSRAGYLSAIQAGSVFIFSVFGGVFVDHRDPRRIMLAVDIVRAFAVLCLPIACLFTTLNLWLLIPVAILVSSLSA